MGLLDVSLYTPTATPLLAVRHALVAASAIYRSLGRLLLPSSTANALTGEILLLCL